LKITFFLSEIHWKYSWSTIYWDSGDLIIKNTKSNYSMPSKRSALSFLAASW
jgi:hypothetical protein